MNKIVLQPHRLYLYFFSFYFMTTEKIFGKTYRVGTKWHQRALAQKKHFEELQDSETGFLDTDYEEMKKQEGIWEETKEMRNKVTNEFYFFLGQLWK